MKHGRAHGPAFIRLSFVLLLGLFVVACGSTTGDQTVTPEVTAPSETVAPATGSAYTLRTIGAASGRLMYMGIEGPIGGRVNPDLVVGAGEEVEITLVIGNDQTHDIVSPDVGLASEQISGNGATTTATFTAPDEPGSYPYWSSVDGDREAGLEGMIVVVE